MSQINLVLFGCGGVGCALLEMLDLPSFKKMGIAKITIFDPRDLSVEPHVAEMIKNNRVIHNCIEITKENLSNVLQNLKKIFSVKTRNIIVDVSYNIYFQPLIQWCLDNNVCYLNTSMERWPSENEDILEKNFYPRTLYHIHDIFRKLKSKNRKTPSIVVEHGMNPGLITHFTKMGILNVAREVLEKAEDGKIELEQLSRAYNDENFPLLSFLLGLETVHCSEKDSQISKTKRKDNEFMNTWGAYSFYGEGVDPVQLGYGTHEKKIENSFIPPKNLEQNQVFLPIRGIDLQFQSFVPEHGLIHGMVIPHGENDTIGRCLTLYQGKKVIYRPSNYYVYSPCQEAWNSIENVRKNNYKMLKTQHALRGHEIKSGADAVGALLIFKSNPFELLLHGNSHSLPLSYWSGTILSINQTRKMGLKYAGPTVVQVAISLIAVLNWMKENPERGLCFPEDLPYDYVLSFCREWLGNVFMDWVSYSPSSTLLGSFLV